MRAKRTKPAIGRRTKRTKLLTVHKLLLSLERGKGRGQGAWDRRIGRERFLLSQNGNEWRMVRLLFFWRAVLSHFAPSTPNLGSPEFHQHFAPSSASLHSCTLARILAEATGIGSFGTLLTNKPFFVPSLHPLWQRISEGGGNQKVHRFLP